jgi:hypothetical protein
MDESISKDNACWKTLRNPMKYIAYLYKNIWIQNSNTFFKHMCIWDVPHYNGWEAEHPRE